MTPGRTWSVAFATGLIAMLAMAFVPWLPLVVALLVAGLGAFGRRAIGVSGVLVGFGLLWFVLVGLQFVTGGQSDQWPLIFGVGIAAIGIGVAVAVVGTWDD